MPSVVVEVFRETVINGGLHIPIWEFEYEILTQLPDDKKSKWRIEKSIDINVRDKSDVNIMRMTLKALGENLKDCVLGDNGVFWNDYLASKNLPQGSSVGLEYNPCDHVLVLSVVCN